MTREEWLKTAAVIATGAALPKGVLAQFLAASDEIKRSDFGKDFVWGTATASYQIEGAWNEDGKGESIWDNFTHRKGGRKIKTRENGDTACDFYHRYEGDIEMMRKMNIPASRFSISWSRILPDGTGRVNQKGIDFYKRVIEKCHKEGIEPWVTCYHWDLPQALQNKGGWTNRDILGWFEEYVSLCAKSFGDSVKKWMVFNEPMAFVGGGYLIGLHAPGIFGFKSFYKATHHVTMSHAVGGKVLKNLVKDGDIGTTYSCSPIDSVSHNALDMRAAKQADAFLNRMYIEPVLGMGYPTKDLPALRHVEKYMKADDEKNIVFDFDFIGIQNYTRTVAQYLGIVPILNAINVPPKKLGEVTEMNWEVYPEGIYRVLKQFADYKQIKRLYVTENGAAFPDVLENNTVNDTQRTQFLKDYLKNVLKAKNEGVNVEGYFVWSFMDNFEWAEGYKPRFGLVYNDFKTQQRTIKNSGKWYSNFLAEK
ncbi:MAG: GH1 family beta-glucosidase [Chitinophagales bacterium]|nr:GH1 family beta-glucosidase [Chitinophagales bacterium]